MAPEQIRGAFLDEPTDVWGIGMVLHEAASGRRPFLAGGQRAPQLDQRATRLGSVRRMPADFASLVDRCLDPDPAARPALTDVIRGCRALTR